MEEDIVQAKNLKTNRYIKIDRTKGIILSRKKTEGPYKKIPIVGEDHATP